MPDHCTFVIEGTNPTDNSQVFYECKSTIQISYVYFHDARKPRDILVRAICERCYKRFYAMLMEKENRVTYEIKELERQRNRNPEIMSVETIQGKTKLNEEIKEKQRYRSQVRFKFCRLDGCNHPLTCFCPDCSTRQIGNKVCSIDVKSPNGFTRGHYGFHQRCIDIVKNMFDGTKKIEKELQHTLLMSWFRDIQDLVLEIVSYPWFYQNHSQWMLIRHVKQFVSDGKTILYWSGLQAVWRIMQGLATHGQDVLQTVWQHFQPKEHKNQPKGQKHLPLLWRLSQGIIKICGFKKKKDRTTGIKIC